jgi:DNA-binding transcriptional regulator LsrR (DeoR family)
MGPLGEEIHANEIARRLASRVVGIELNDLPQLPWVFGAAVGVEKAPAVLGALRGGYINVLVTDEPTARACLRLARAG